MNFLRKAFVTLLTVEWLFDFVGERVRSLATLTTSRGMLNFGRLLLDQHILSANVLVSLSTMDFTDVLNHCNIKRNLPCYFVHHKDNIYVLKAFAVSTEATVHTSTLYLLA